MELKPRASARQLHTVLDSTNAEAMRQAAAGATGPLWIVAAHQTAARGRRGRVWASAPGNFAASLIYHPPGGLSELALRSFVAALALRDALCALGVAGASLLLKWPNDVLLSGRKLAGILLETIATSAGGPGLIVGIGVNLSSAPDASVLEETALTPTSVRAQTGLLITPEALLDALVPSFEHWEARLVSEGFAPVREAWLAHAARLGEPVIARLPGRRISGIFETVDSTGALVLGTHRGPQVLPAADLHFASVPEAEVAPDAARN